MIHCCLNFKCFTVSSIELCKLWYVIFLCHRSKDIYTSVCSFMFYVSCMNLAYLHICVYMCVHVCICHQLFLHLYFAFMCAYVFICVSFIFVALAGMCLMYLFYITHVHYLSEFNISVCRVVSTFVHLLSFHYVKGFMISVPLVQWGINNSCSID